MFRFSPDKNRKNLPPRGEHLLLRSTSLEPGEHLVFHGCISRTGRHISLIHTGISLVRNAFHFSAAHLAFQETNLSHLYQHLSCQARISLFCRASRFPGDESLLSTPTSLLSEKHFIFLPRISPVRRHISLVGGKIGSGKSSALSKMAIRIKKRRYKKEYR